MVDLSGGLSKNREVEVAFCAVGQRLLVGEEGLKPEEHQQGLTQESFFVFLEL